MKKLGKVFIAICLLLFFIKCKEDNKGLQVFDIKDLKTDSSVKLSDLDVIDINYFPLETNKLSLFGNIWKLKPGNNTICILDGNGDIFEFSYDGKFLSRIGKRGNGPQEYQAPYDISINPGNQDVCVLSPLENKIYIYSSNGNFLKSITCPIRTRSLFCRSNYILCFNPNTHGIIESPVVCIDYDGNVIKSYPDKYKFSGSKFTGGFISEFISYGFNNQVFTKEIYSDTVFNFDNLNFIPAYILDHGGQTLKVQKRENANNFNEFMDLSSESVIQQNLFQLKNFIYYEFSFNNNWYTYIGFNNDVSHFLTLKNNGFINDIDGGPNIWFSITKDDQTIISIINAFELKNYVASNAFKNSTPIYPEKKKQLEQLANSLNENDNPVLMLVKLKE